MSFLHHSPKQVFNSGSVPLFKYIFVFFFQQASGVQKRKNAAQRQSLTKYSEVRGHCVKRRNKHHTHSHISSLNSTVAGFSQECHFNPKAHGAGGVRHHKKIFNRQTEDFNVPSGSHIGFPSPLTTI